MINQELINYIKQQLAGGANKEQVKSSLLSNGWDLKDIEEGFNAVGLSDSTDQASVNANTFSEKKLNLWKIVSVILIGVLIILGGFLGYLFLGEEQGQYVEQIDGFKTEELEINNDLQIISCEETINFKNISCFIDAVKNCSPASMVVNSEIELFGGLTSKTKGLYEIRGLEEDGCVFYIKTESVDVGFDGEAIQGMLDSGMTMKEIKEREQKVTKTSKATEGRDGTCLFKNTDDLVSLINKWSKGSFSSEDFENYDCRGEYFGKGEQLANTSKTITSEDCMARGGYSIGVNDNGTACFKSDVDLGSIVGYVKINGKYPQCCVSQ